MTQRYTAINSHGGEAELVQDPRGKVVLAEDFERLRQALHDAIRRPLGVVPASAEEFYCHEDALLADARRKDSAKQTQKNNSPF